MAAGGRNEFQSTLPTRGSDDALKGRRLISYDFNPRSPRGGATIDSLERTGHSVISIHAPRKGERQGRGGSNKDNKDFNPRSPQGGATISDQVFTNPFIFQSTLPARGSDRAKRIDVKGDLISIHAPRKGERHQLRGMRFRPFYRFQSTLPARGSDFMADGERKGA